MTEIAPSPIPPHLVHTVFQYLLPPSLPVPPHLLSRPLAERHYHLSISPSDPASYLCWPSDNTPKVIDTLENAIDPEPVAEPQHTIRYTAPDVETTLAHVQPNPRSPLQIVFAWDEASASWKYHDARLLPFPASSTGSLEEALARRPHVNSDSRSGSPSSDNYWDGYDTDSSNKAGDVPNIMTEDEDKAEAAYWASYGVVHGSGDSTVPSPKPLINGPHDHHGYSRGPETTFDPFVANLHLKLREHEDNNAFLSPMYPRSERSSEPPMNEHDEEPRVAEKVKEEDSVWYFPKEVKMLGPSGEGIMCSTGVCKLGGMKETVKEDKVQDEGLKEAVRGLYRMWKTSSGGDLNDTNAFISIVKDALSGA